MRKTKPLSKDDLCYVEEEEVDENGICDFVPGDPVSMFTFHNGTVPSNEPMLKEKPVETSLEVPIKSSPALNLPDNRTLKSEPNGITPPIDGEYFVIKKGFTFRRSTVRKLNELKSTHPVINVYLNTIIDEAVCHYYEYIFKENGSQN